MMKVSKFTVIKNDDLTTDQKNRLTDILKEIAETRKQEGRKTNNNYYVINTDESYIGDVEKIMMKHGHWDY
jgi:hypothetical protein